MVSEAANVHCLHFLNHVLWLMIEVLFSFLRYYSLVFLKGVLVRDPDVGLADGEKDLRHQEVSYSLQNNQKSDLLW